MSKGEFEKRIKWLEENPEKDAGKLISRVTASAFREIVDEARTEFPIKAYKMENIETALVRETTHLEFDIPTKKEIM